jgi:nucleoid-associated protein YgaU
MLPAAKVLIVLLGLAAFGGAVAYFGMPPQPGPGKPQTAEQANPPPAPTPAPQQTAKAEPAVPEPAAPAAAPAAPAPAKSPAPAPAAATPPVFDVVRVEPTGDLVVAGRAPAGALVELLRDGSLIDKVKADEGGQFAFVPPPLPPGAFQLSLMARLIDGRSEPSRQTVTVSVPERASPKEVVVALSAPDKPTEILNQPPAVAAPGPAPKNGQAAAPKPGEPRRGVAIATVESEDAGTFFATGTAAPGANVRLYLNETYLATATASAEGKWSFTVKRGLDPGTYRVRLDDVEPATGTVLSRAEVPFDLPARPLVAAAKTPGAAPNPAAETPKAAAGGATPPAPAPAAPPTLVAEAPTAGEHKTVAPADVVVQEVRTATVLRGDSLWRISRKIYGKGIRYTVIHEANQQQIRDPARIYPGQVFVLPGERQQL